MNITINFRVHDCLKCKALFAIPEDVNSQYKKNHKVFYCPYCKQNHWFPAQSDNEKLKKRLRVVEQSNENCRIRRNRAENQVRAYRGVVTKLKKKYREADSK